MLFKTNFPTARMFKGWMKGHIVKTCVEFFKEKRICKLLSNNEINLESISCPQFGSQRGDTVVSDKQNWVWIYSLLQPSRTCEKDT